MGRQLHALNAAEEFLFPRPDHPQSMHEHQRHACTKLQNPTTSQSSPTDLAKESRGKDMPPRNKLKKKKKAGSTTQPRLSSETTGAAPSTTDSIAIANETCSWSDRRNMRLLLSSPQYDASSYTPMEEFFWRPTPRPSERAFERGDDGLRKREEERKVVSLMALDEHVISGGDDGEEDGEAGIGNCLMASSDPHQGEEEEEDEGVQGFSSEGLETHSESSPASSEHAHIPDEGGDERSNLRAQLQQQQFAPYAKATRRKDRGFPMEKRALSPVAELEEPKDGWKV